MINIDMAACWSVSQQFVVITRRWAEPARLRPVTAPILCVRLLLPRPPLEEEPGQAQGLALPLVRFGPRIQAGAD